MKLLHPLGFMLASPVETVEEALQRFSTEVAEEGLAGPIIKEAPIREAQLEDKYDGVRARSIVAHRSILGGWRSSPVPGRI